MDEGDIISDIDDIIKEAHLISLKIHLCCCINDFGKISKDRKFKVFQNVVKGG